MAKKHKKKKNKRYSKKQFKNAVCADCPICKGVPKNPDFCFPMYNDDPYLFISEILPMLEKVGNKPDSWPFDTKDEVNLFETTFCYSCICRGDWTSGEENEMCPLIPDCMEEFTLQVKNTKGHSKNKKKKRDKKTKYIRKDPTPTFFCSSKEGFREKIEEILKTNAACKNNTVK